MIGYFADGAASAMGSDAYDPWGNPVSAAGHQTDLGYQGEYTDGDDGSGGTAVLMGARWYDPSAGEFENADTVANDPTPAVGGRKPATWLAEMTVWITGEAELVAVRPDDGWGVSKHFDLASPDDLETALGELASLIAGASVPSGAVTAWVARGR